MSALNIRRLIVVAVSFALGIAISWATVVIGFPIIKPEEAGITIAKFGYGLFALLALFPSLLILAWLDYFLDTRIHPE